MNLFLRAGAALSLIFTIEVVSACGGASANGNARSTHGDRGSSFDAATFLVDYAAAHGTPLHAPSQEIEALKVAQRLAPDITARRSLTRDLAYAYAWTAEHSTNDEEKTTDWREVARQARTALQNNRDPQLAMDISFVMLVRAWRTAADDAARRATQFTSAYTTASELVRIAWMIRGEIALAASDWAGAREGFRYVQGDVEHPLYAYALYRTAAAYRGEGDENEAHQTLVVVSALGCTADAAPEARAIGERAWSDLGSPAREGGSLPDRPWCPVNARRGSGTGLDLR